MEITVKDIKDTVTLYANQNFKKFQNIDKEDMVICAKKLGYVIPPYLATEAYLVSCGGHLNKGSGPFDHERLHKWLLQREIRLGRGKNIN